ncbi:hypothetical protein BCF74_13328 [Knoellia remsis]|uniref:Uncharacterized protein n=1 Tax=Knoellia remsis TaxID=407159 RepID=A0A2T0U3K5_9MICO|nr:hypothetical protein BCF74_13328 [Knoellia remsis]
MRVVDGLGLILQFAPELQSQLINDPGDGQLMGIEGGTLQPRVLDTHARSFAASLLRSYLPYRSEHITVMPYRADLLDSA